MNKICYKVDDILHAFVIPLMRPKHPPHPILLVLIILVIFGKDFEAFHYRGTSQNSVIPDYMIQKQLLQMAEASRIL
jgi:hypothetical protein